MRSALPLALGLGMTGAFWVAFAAPFPLAEFCDRRQERP